MDKIGAFCSIAKNVTLTNFNHPTNLMSTHSFLYHCNRGFIRENRNDLINNKNRNGKVTIGNDVWIGMNVTILPNIKIGNGSIIGAGAVVVKDVPDYAIVVGVPAKVIKYRFSEEKIKLLNKICWWDWSDEKIRENIELFYDENKFFKKFT